MAARRTANAARTALKVARVSPRSRLIATSTPTPAPSRSALRQRGFSCAASLHATPTAAPPSSVDPADVQAQNLLDEGSSLLEAGDIEGAQDRYERSLQTKETASGHYNLGIALYQLKQVPAAIAAWQRSLSLHTSPDVHTNLASAYILSSPPEPLKALEHLKEAVKLAPGDPEIRFNLGAVNEANGNLADALQEYTCAKDLGIDRADQNIRNVGAKLLRQKMSEEEAKTASSS